MPADHTSPARGRVSSELSPHQQESIRRHLVLIPAYVWLIYIGRVFFEQFPLTGPSQAVSLYRDFAHFYLLGTIANAHDAASLFSVERQMSLMRELVPGIMNVHFQPSYGPQVALLFAPLARLPYVAALTVWLVLTTAVYAFCGRAIWRVCPALGDRKWPVAVLLAGAPAFHFLMMYAQTSALALAAFVGVYLALRSDREFLAGACVGLLAYKPQLGLAAAVVFVCTGRWRVVVGALVVWAVQLLSAAIYWGPGVLLEYAEALGRIPETMTFIEPGKQHLHSWRSFFQLLGLPPAVVPWATLAASLATLVSAIRVWRSRRSTLARRYSVLLFSTVLVSPHLYVYDLIVVTPALVLLSNEILTSWRSESSTTVFQLSVGALLLLIYVSPLLEFLAATIRIQFSVVGLAAAQGLLAVVSPSPGRSSSSV